MTELCPTADDLHRLISGVASDAPSEEVASHVENCTTCRQKLENLASGGLTLGQFDGVNAALSPRDNEMLARIGQKAQTIRVPPQHRELPMVPGFESEELLGTGGQATVVLARQARLGGRLVALKLIGNHTGMVVREHLTRFRTEADAIARLEHPNIVRIYEVGEHGPLSYLVLEYVDGGTLKERIAGRPLAPRQAAEIVETIAVAVQYAHDRGVIHRDLKPRNILLTRNGVPKISDFGLARFTDMDSSCTQTNQPMGTKEYMSPEQAQGKTKKIGSASDVYSLGVILYETLTGRPPFVGDENTDHVALLQQICHDEPPLFRHLRVKVSRDLETICQKCLKKEASKRYRSARELALDLRRFLDGESIQARPATRFERVSRWAKRRLATLLLASVAAVLAVIVALQYVEKNRRDRTEIAIREGGSLVEQDQLDKAIVEKYKPAYELDPKSLSLAAEYGRAHLRRARMLAAKNEFGQAIEDFERVLELDGQNEAAALECGQALHEIGSYFNASEMYYRVRKINPKNTVVMRYLGKTWHAQEEYALELETYEEALRIAADDVEILRQKAWVCATCPDARWRDGRQALADANRACELSEWKSEGCLEALAASHAELGDFDEAIKYQTKAIEIAKEFGRGSPSERLARRMRLELFQARQPYRDVPTGIMEPHPAEEMQDPDPVPLIPGHPDPLLEFKGGVFGSPP